MVKFVQVAALVACVAGGAQAFVTPTLTTKVPMAKPQQQQQQQQQARRSVTTMSSTFENATGEFTAAYKPFAASGWGPSVKAERWNGRHAMFGWVMIIGSAYAKAHGLIPDAETALSFKDWGTLAILNGPDNMITNERAVIMIAHVHALMVSVCATIAPLSFQDKLLLEKGEKDEPMQGLIPKFVPGITPEAEMFNGRMAMLGLVAFSVHCLSTGTPFLEAVNTSLGGLLM